MSAIAVPDLIEPLVGWRVWRVTRAMKLTSMYYEATWPTDRPVRAYCGDLLGHPAPHEGCKCGIHAALTLERAAEYLPEKLRRYHPEPIPTLRKTRLVFGRVKLWGRVTEYELGYRAEYAYPLDVFVPTAFECWRHDAAGAARALADRYCIPVTLIRRAADLREEVPV